MSIAYTSGVERTTLKSLSFTEGYSYKIFPGYSYSFPYFHLSLGSSLYNLCDCCDIFFYKVNT